MKDVKCLTRSVTQSWPLSHHPVPLSTNLDKGSPFSPLFGPIAWGQVSIWTPLSLPFWESKQVTGSIFLLPHWRQWFSARVDTQGAVLPVCLQVYRYISFASLLEISEAQLTTWGRVFEPPSTSVWGLSWIRIVCLLISQNNRLLLRFSLPQVGISSRTSFWVLALLGPHVPFGSWPTQPVSTKWLWYTVWKCHNYSTSNKYPLPPISQIKGWLRDVDAHIQKAYVY